jgi:hypothetical protein
MDDTTFFARVQAHLDARTDPMDDDALVAALDAEPARLDAFSRLLADTRGLAAVVARPVRAGRRAMVAALVAAGLAIAVWFAVAGRGATDRNGRVLQARFEIHTAGARLAAPFAVREILIDRPSQRLETWQTRSIPR